VGEPIEFTSCVKKGNDMRVPTEMDFQNNKRPFVRMQFGVLDATSGGVSICSNRETAHAAVERFPERYTPMKRHVSEWVKDE